MDNHTFTPCMEFMKAWSNQHNLYIERWSTDKGRLTFFVTGESEPREFSLRHVMNFYVSQNKAS